MRWRQPDELLRQGGMAQRFFIKLEAPHPADDDEGYLYESLDHARDDAIRFLADLLKDRTQEIVSGEAWQVLVYDEQSNLVCRLGFTAEYPG